MANSLLGRCMPWVIVFIAIFASIVSFYIANKIREGEAEYQRHHSNWLIRNVASTKLEEAKKQLQQARELLFLTSSVAALAWCVLILLVVGRSLISLCKKGKCGGKKAEGGQPELAAGGEKGGEDPKVVELSSDSSASSGSVDEKDWEVVGDRK